VSGIGGRSHSLQDAIQNDEPVELRIPREPASLPRPLVQAVPILGAQPHLLSRERLSCARRSPQGVRQAR
jgi:hypothetical protein